jgi:transcriptional regulator with XRE-family HTH domain
MKELKTIGKNISQLRKARNMTQEDLCGLAQIDRSYLSELENGKMNVTIKSLVTIAQALDCDLKSLILEE